MHEQSKGFKAIPPSFPVCAASQPGIPDAAEGSVRIHARYFQLRATEPFRRRGALRVCFVSLWTEDMSQRPRLDIRRPVFALRDPGGCQEQPHVIKLYGCLLYTSDAA